MGAREMRALANALHAEAKDCFGGTASPEGQALLRLCRAHNGAAARLERDATLVPHALDTLANIRAIIGNVDHSKGHGPNAAEMRGGMLNDIRDLCEKALRP